MDAIDFIIIMLIVAFAALVIALITVWIKSIRRKKFTDTRRDRVYAQYHSKGKKGHHHRSGSHHHHHHHSK